MDIEAVAGDITTQQVDAVVNAANSSLLGGGGVDGAIHRAAGPGLLAECMELRRTELPDGLPVGRAVPTAGHDLPAPWVIHTVGPNRHRGQTDPAELAACFTSALEVAGTVAARSVAFPAVGAGVYGWDATEVAERAVAAVREFAERPDHGIDLVRFVLFDEEILGAFQAELGRR
ncbi:O-acetyl-ADP-ribose deacetylase [Georgenia sp. MJ170]|uniref:O-acetyl-ADP-ribose deacetylase n=1 Tax=Georgenia sunbinii TaxID=3117728 RepID=UPI002F268D53